MNKRLLPFALFLLLAMLLGVGLKLNPRELPSPLIAKPAPDFTLPQLHQPDQRWRPQDLRGQVWLLNVWASWCGSCRIEHPVLMDFARQKKLPLIGLNYKDQGPDALAWLREHGDPYQHSVVDRDGRVGIDYGVYGVPETFVIDRQGVIRHKQVGPVTEEVLRKTLLPIIEDLQR